MTLPMLSDTTLHEVSETLPKKNGKTPHVDPDPVEPVNLDPAPSSFRKEGKAYVYEPQVGSRSLGIRFIAEHIKVKDTDCFGLVTVKYLGDARHPDILGPMRANFYSSRTPFVNELIRAYGLPDIREDHWRQSVERFFTRVLKSFDNQLVFKRLGEEQPSQAPTDIVSRLIEAGQSTILFGPGNTGKGWIAIALALCAQHGLPFCGLTVKQTLPLYLDWEADETTFIWRVRAVAAALGIERPSLLRAEVRRPLRYHTDEIARAVDTEGIGLIIHDSVGRGSMRVGERGGYEDVAKDWTDAILDLGPSAAHLMIDHVSGDGMGKNLAGKPIGAARKIYDARIAWEARSDQDDGADSSVIGLYHQKGNNRRKFSPMAIRLDFESDAYGRAVRVAFTRVDMGDTALVSRLPQQQQVKAMLRRGPMSTSVIAGELDVRDSVAEAILNRLKERSVVIPVGTTHKGSKIECLWGLLDPQAGSDPVGDLANGAVF